MEVHDPSIHYVLGLPRGQGMSGLRSDDGHVHIISDGPSPSRLFALCDIVATGWASVHPHWAHRMRMPNRNWGPEEAVDGVASCLSCIGVVLEAIDGNSNG